MRRLWPGIVALFDRREEATSLACVRIGVGLIVLYGMISAAWAGLVGSLWVDIKHGGFLPVHGFWVIRLFGGASPIVIYSLFTAAIVSSVLLIAGVFARAAALVSLLAYASLVSTHGDTSGGGDLMVTNALWLLALSRSGATLSLPAKLRTGSFRTETLVPAWPRYLLIFQLLVVYTAAGFNKMAVPWTPMGGYTALHFVLQDPTFVRFSSDAFLSISPLTRIATAVTWHWEQLTFLLFLYFYCDYTRERGGRIRRFVTRFDWRKPWVTIGIGLHVGIFTTLNVGAFSLIAVTYYFALWRPKELDAAAAKIRAKLRR